MLSIYAQYWERRGNMVYGEDRGPGMAPLIKECENAREAQRVVDEHNAKLRPEETA